MLVSQNLKELKILALKNPIQKRKRKVVATQTKGNVVNTEKTVKVIVEIQLVIAQQIARTLRFLYLTDF